MLKVLKFDEDNDTEERKVDVCLPAETWDEIIAALELVQEAYVEADSDAVVARRTGQIITELNKQVWGNGQQGQ